MNLSLTVPTGRQGLHEITRQVRDLAAGTGISDGLVTLFIRHTSASLVIQENADEAVLVDMSNWLNRLVPEDERLYTHKAEGLDDMPAHIKSALTATSLSIPLIGGELAFGVWQGIFLWEHRHRRDNREVLINVMGS